MNYTYTPLTEDQIERRVEQLIDRLDARYSKGLVSDSSYEQEQKNINEWAYKEYLYAKRYKQHLSNSVAVPTSSI